MSVQRGLFFGGLLLILSAPAAGQTTFGWELTGTNVLNNANYSNPVVNISSLAQVGVISGIGDVSDLDPSGPRSFRIGLRLEW